MPQDCHVVQGAFLRFLVRQLRNLTLPFNMLHSSKYVLFQCMSMNFEKVHLLHQSLFFLSQFILLKVTISRASLDKEVISEPQQDGDMEGQKPSVPSMRFMAGGNAWIMKWRQKMPQERKFFFSSHNAWELLGDLSWDQYFHKQHQILLIAFNWVLNKPKVNNASLVTLLPAWKPISWTIL